MQEEAIPSTPDESILIFDENSSTLMQGGETVARQFPQASVTLVHDFEQFADIVHNRDFDVVLMSLHQPMLDAPELVQRLRLKDHEPSVIFILGATEPSLVSALYQVGVQKVIIRDNDWLGELGPTLRHAFRLRRLENENTKLMAKLTEANQLLEEKNKRLDEFSASIAHDIRGPLGALAMKLEYIIDKCETQLELPVISMLKRAFESTERLISIVQTMYDFARIGAGATRMQEVNLATLISQVLSDLHFDDKLDIKIGVDNLPVVWGNDELLRRVFINLINNAVKYNDKSEIIINIGVNKIAANSLARYCEVFVEDNGPGVKQSELEDIFAMFKRGTKHAHDKDGCGIGLSVARRILDLHFGTIRVESTEGKGAKFVLSLPMEKIDLNA